MLTLLRNPTTGLAALSAEMDRVLNDFAPARGGWTQGLAPAADVLETEADFRVVLDMPGHDPKAIQIQVENDTLTVQAERKQPEGAKGETVHRSERSFGTFARSFSLPTTVDASRVEAKYDNGVLVVVLPKREESKPRTIQVNVK